MSVVGKAAALLLLVRRQEVEELPPAERRRLADLCRHVAGLAEPRNPVPNAGILYDLKRYRRDE